MSDKWTVGQKVYVVPNNDGGRGLTSYEETITKLGRKWGYLQHWERNKFDLKTGEIDGGQYTSPAKVYPDKELYDLHVLRQARWANIKQHMPYIVPNTITDGHLVILEGMLGAEE